MHHRHHQHNHRYNHQHRRGRDWVSVAMAVGLLPWAMACSPAWHDGLTAPGLPGEGLPRAMALSTAAPAAPSAQDVQALIDSVPGPGSDTSVPSATATFAAEAAGNTAIAGQDKPTTATTASGLTAAQQSSAMPMPGQANSHSTPSAHPPLASPAASAQR